MASANLAQADMDRLILEAMREELGNKRLDTLPLQDRRDRGPSYCPGNRQRMAPRVAGISAVGNAWNAAIQAGDFDDAEAQAVKDLDDLGGARVYASVADVRKQNSRNLEVFTAFPQQQPNNVGGRHHVAPNEPLAAGNFRLGKHKVGKLGGVIPDGGMVVTFPKFKPAGPSKPPAQPAAIQERQGIRVRPIFPPVQQKQLQKQSQKQPQSEPGPWQPSITPQAITSFQSAPLVQLPSHPPTYPSALLFTPAQTPTTAAPPSLFSVANASAVPTAPPHVPLEKTAVANNLIDFDDQLVSGVVQQQQKSGESGRPEAGPGDCVTVVYKKDCHLLQLLNKNTELDGCILLRTTISPGGLEDAELEEAALEIWVNGKLVAEHSLRDLMGIRRNKRIVGTVFDVDGGVRHVLHFDPSEEVAIHFGQVLLGIKESLADADAKRETAKAGAVPSAQLQKEPGSAGSSDSNGTCLSPAASHEPTTHVPDFANHFVSLFGMLSMKDQKEAAGQQDFTVPATHSERMKQVVALTKAQESQNAIDGSLQAANYRTTIVSVAHVMPFLRLLGMKPQGHGDGIGFD